MPYIGAGFGSQLADVNSDFLYNIQKGAVANTAVSRSTGYINMFSSVGATEFDIWGAAPTKTKLTYLGTGETLSVVSTDARDDAGDVGATKVMIKGLDNTLTEISEEVTMNGLTPVVTTKVFFRVNECYVSETGNDEKNLGVISLTPTVTVAALQGQINIGDSRMFNSHYTVPFGKAAYLYFLCLSDSKEDDLKVRLKARSLVPSRSPFVTMMTFYLYNTALLRPIPYIKFDAGTDILLTAQGLGGVVVNNSISSSLEFVVSPR